MNEHTYGRQKDENYIPLGINAGGIKSRELHIKSRDSRAFPWKNFFINTFYIKGCLFYFFNFILDRNLCKQTVMLRSVASLLGLHCLCISLLWDATHKWVKAVSSACLIPLLSSI